jgi:hypothetical protein
MAADVEPQDERPPSYGLALVAVLLGGVASSYVSVLLVGVTPYLGRDGWFVVASLVGAWPVRLFLAALGYRISYVAAVLALLTGAVIATLATRLIVHGAPGLLTSGGGTVTALPSLLLSAWIVQLAAARPARPLA